MATKLLIEEEFLPDEISFAAGGDEVGSAGAWLLLGGLMFLVVSCLLVAVLVVTV